MDNYFKQEFVNDRDIHAYGMSVVGLVRKVNEDHCGYSHTQNGELFVVCDGMGGHVGGAVASKIGVTSIIEHLESYKYDDLRVALNSAISFANTQIVGYALEHPDLEGMGTTACVMLVKDGQCWIAHVGDSRIYLFENDNKTLYRVTKDHSLVQSLVDKGDLDDRQAEHHARKNVILRALGVDSQVVAEISSTPLLPRKGDVFLICSDGLCGMIDDNEIEKILSEKTSLENALEKLIQNAGNTPGKGQDNCTGEVIEFKGDDASASSHPDYNPVWRKEYIQNRTREEIMPRECRSEKSPSGDGKHRKWALWSIVAVAVIVLAFVVVLLVSRNDKSSDPPPEEPSKIENKTQEIKDKNKETQDSIENARK